MNVVIGIALLSACLSFSSLFTAVSETNLSPLGDISQVKIFFESNLNTLSKEFKKQFCSKWRPSSVENVSYLMDYFTNDDCGYIVSFDNGYLAYSFKLEVYDFDTSIILSNDRQYYLSDKKVGYIDGDLFTPIKQQEDESLDNYCGRGLENTFFSVDGVTGLNNFSLTSCLCPIPFLMSHYTNIEYGDWLPLCINQESKDCAPTAFSNLVWMYKEKGLCDLTLGVTPSEGRKYFASLAGTTEEGTKTSNIHPAMQRYLEVAKAVNGGDEWLALAGSIENYPSYLCFERDGEGHAAVRIGTGQSDYWWFFKSYWSIVVTWGTNYIYNESTHSCVWTGIDGDLNACIYVADTQYVKHSWTLQRK